MEGAAESGHEKLSTRYNWWGIPLKLSERNCTTWCAMLKNLSTPQAWWIRRKMMQSKQKYFHHRCAIIPLRFASID